MMTFNQDEFAQFFAATARKSKPALQTLVELESRGGGETRGNELRRHLDRMCQKNGLNLNEVTGAQIAELLRTQAWGRHA